MDLMTFIGVIIVVCILGGLGTFLVKQVGGEVSVWGAKAILIVCVIIIIVVLLNALGLGHNVRIPALF